MKSFKLIKLRVLFLLFICLACASRNSGVSSRKSNLLSSSVSEQFELSDKSGRFLLKRESGRESSNKNFVVRQSLNEMSGKRETLEQLITVSQIGTLNNKLMVMRPLRSQYSIWFEGQRYFSEMELDIPTKSMKVKLRSPESQWNGEENIRFPDDQSVYCFFATLIECAGLTGFISTAIEKKIGRMNLMIIWEGYPYMSSQYSDIPDELFTAAILEYDGNSDRHKNRFSLRFAGQSLFFFVSDNGRFDRYFWVSQGLSVVRRGQSADL
jgi:hypothetical protein